MVIKEFFVSRDVIFKEDMFPFTNATSCSSLFPPMSSSDTGSMLPLVLDSQFRELQVPVDNISTSPADKQRLQTSKFQVSNIEERQSQMPESQVPIMHENQCSQADPAHVLEPTVQ
ncbi:hypothetical protein HAX54_022868 [Datura stramonium]|uniref:Uncharacterized protein n=1 Tax=Datura stramonium TaxID=4076 RepID=A0ABS8UY36_DATST|nr:hypothetical protein [Datura stramonium]